MPSDTRTRLVLDALQLETARFRRALAAASDELRDSLAAQRSTLEGQAERLAAELGPFGARRIDSERLARFVGAEPPSDPSTLDALARAIATLDSLASRGEGLFVVTVRESGGLREAVAAALADVGRAFRAARVAHEVRTRRRALSANGDAPGPLAFADWSRAERRLAPPLVARVLGADLRPASLAEFLDGRQKLVLIVEGDCAPAPLARLVSPRTFVLQTHDGRGLDRFGAWDGPGIAALLPESAARFVHDPSAGPASWQRLTVQYVPEATPRRTVGGLSPAQQVEELELLRTLAAPPAPSAPAGAAAPAAAPAADPADRLASWLLRQVDLKDLG